MRDARFVDLTAAILMRNPKLTHHKVAPTSPGHAGRDVASAPSDAAGGTVTCRLIHILNVGLRTISAGGSLGVPATVLVFVFDHLRVARHALIGSGHAGRSEGLGVGRKWLREHAVDRVRPAVVVPDDLICDMRHRFTFQYQE